MLDILVSSKTRVKLLLKFFLNSETKSYLRHLEAEFNESTNAIRLELNKFEKAGMLVSEFEGNKKIFRANTNHPLYNDIHSIIKKYVGLDWIIDYVVKGLGNVNSVYLTGGFADGIESSEIEILLIGNINEDYLKIICKSLEKKISKSLKYNIVDNQNTFDKLCEDSDNKYLLLWRK
jgi:hypothetical protein